MSITQVTSLAIIPVSFDNLDLFSWRERKLITSYLFLDFINYLSGLFIICNIKQAMNYPQRSDGWLCLSWESSNLLAEEHILQLSEEGNTLQCSKFWLLCCDCYTHISSLTLHVSSSCVLAIPEKTDFADKARQEKTFTASFSFCWMSFFFPWHERKSILKMWKVYLMKALWTICLGELAKFSKLKIHYNFNIIWCI